MKNTKTKFLNLQNSQKISQKIVMIMFVVLALLLVGCKPTATIGNTDSGMSQGAQVVNLGLDRGGYLPREITVKEGVPVTLKNDGSLGGCGLYPMQPELGMNANFAQNSEYTFTPTKKGTYTFTCSMGMYKGTMNVV